MIARMWHGRVRQGLLDEYRAYIARTGAAELKATPGNLATYVFTRERDDHGEVIVLSLWDREESIRAFAGEELLRARYYPEDPQYLLELPEYLDHYDAL